MIPLIGAILLICVGGFGNWMLFKAKLRQERFDKIDAIAFVVFTVIAMVGVIKLVRL